MAKLQVSADLLLESLFKGAAPGLRILSATADPITHVVELDIEGPAVPEVERVSAIVSVERFTVRFEPRS